MSAVALLAAFAVIFFTGYGAARWLLKDARAVCWPEVVGLAWLLGSGVISILLAVGGTLASGPVLIVAVALGGGGLGLYGRRVAAGASALRWFPRGTRPWEKALTFLPLLPVAWLAMQTFRETLHWDGLFVWEIKARLAFFHDGVLPLAYYSDPALLAWTHPGYPLYLPMLELWVYLWLGEANQFWVKAVSPFFYLAAASVLWSAGLRLTGRVWIGALAALLLFAVPRALRAGAGALQGYADLPLAVIYLAALAALLLGAQGERSWLRVAAAMSALLPWVKQEGLVLWGCFALAAIWLWRREWRTALLLVLPGLIVAAAWRAFLFAAEYPTPATFHPLTLETLHTNASRVLPLLQRLGEELLRIRSWSLLWPLAALAFVGLAVQRRRLALPFAGAVILPLALYLVPYVFTAIEPYEQHVETSIDRLVLQLAPLAVLAIALVLGEEVPGGKSQEPRKRQGSRREASSGHRAAPLILES